MKRSNGKIVTFYIGHGQITRIEAMTGDATINRSSFLRDAATQALYRILLDKNLDYLSGVGMRGQEDNYSAAVYLTNTQVKAIDGLVVMGVSPSRSDFLRGAVTMFLSQTERFVREVESLAKARPSGASRSRMLQHGNPIDMRRVPWSKN